MNSRRQFSIWHLMALVLVLSPPFAVARIDASLGAITAAYSAFFLAIVLRARPARCVILPLSVALSTTVALIVGWFAIRDGLLVAGLRLTVPDVGFKLKWPLPVSVQNRLLARNRITVWESWSLLRWWLFFGGLTWLVATSPRTASEGPHRRRGRLTRWFEWLKRSETMPGPAEASRRLLWFAPWLAVMEVGSLCGVWMMHRGFRVIPEPSTLMAAPLFDVRYGIAALAGLNIIVSFVWMLRLLPVMPLVGTAYFRGIAGWPWRRALLGAISLIPAAAVVSVLWSSLYVSFLQCGWIR